jgi:spermidine synthase
MNIDNKFYNEMITHVALCTHPNPQSVLVVSDYELLECTDKHKDINSLKYIGVNNALEFVREADEKSYDIIIVNSDMFANDKVFVGHCNRVLANDGLMVLSNDINELVCDFFRICMPYRFEVSQTSKELFTATFATKKYHPTADLILHKSDLLEGCEYYNSDVHKSSFVLPNYIKSKIKSFVKN